MNLREMLSKMTLREKILQISQQTARIFFGNNLVEDTGPVAELKLRSGDVRMIGSALPVHNPERQIEISREYLKNNPSGIPVTFMDDIIHGFRTIYPYNLGLACSFDESLVEECASMAAKEAYYAGSHVAFAPMTDLSRDARWGRCAESWGEDPLLSSRLTVATVKGFQGDNLGCEKIAACVKHFAAYGAAEAGLDYNTVDMSERELREYYLPMYKAAVDAGVMLVMTSFNTVDGMPSVGNKWLDTDVLRNEWGFEGVVISDWAAPWELVVHGVAEGEREAAELSLNAGCDIEMVSTTYAQKLEELVSEGRVSEADIDEATLRVLRLKERLGLFDDPLRGIDKERAEALFCSDEHREIVRRAARESAVLLKNDRLLPFDEKKIGKIAVIGPHADNGEIIGSWRCNGRPEDTVTVKMGLEALLGCEKVVYAKGCSDLLFETDESGFDEAILAAKECDAVVLCLGENFNDVGEGTSKTDICLSDIQKRLLRRVLAVNKNTALLLFNGRPLCLSDIAGEVPAILDIWFPGTEGGAAAAELLFGRATPSGKLSMSFPRTVGQCPIFYNHYNTGRPRSDDGRRCPYSASYIDSPNSPLYPFGYGLSYTSFEYKDAKLDRGVIKRGESLLASVTLRNTGSYSAKETVQLYIRDLAGSVVRPVRELKAFNKIELAPGEQTSVSFEINEEMLKFYGRDLVRRAECGVFRVFIGGDSNALACGEFTLTD